MLKTRRPPGRGSWSLRLADRYLGVPLVLVVGSLRRKAKTVPQFSSVGLMATAAIGDTILLAGIVSDLRDHFPEKKLVLFTGGSNHEVALLFKGLDEVVRLPTHNPLEAVRMLREKRLDVLVDFGPWPRINALYSLLSGARFTLGFRTSGQYRHYGYDRFVEHSAKLHEIENHRNLMRALGVDSKSLPCIDVDVPLVSGVQPKTYIVFHAWSSGYKSHLREWPEEYWVELAARVVPLGFDIVLTGAPCDLARTQELHSKIGPQIEPVRDSQGAARRSRRGQRQHRDHASGGGRWERGRGDQRTYLRVEVGTSRRPGGFRQYGLAGLRILELGFRV